MEQLASLLEQHGYWLIMAVGFAEYIGVPIASMPVVIVAGALASQGDFPWSAVVLSVAAGGFVADFIWYTAARWRGPQVMNRVCGLSSNPNACVIAVEHRIRALGPVFLIPAKFVPGAGNLAAAGSEFAGIGLRKFLVFDAVGLLVWATVLSSLGWIFADQVGLVVAQAMRFGRWVLLTALLAIATAAIWRVMKVRRHRRAHALERNGSPSPDPVRLPVHL